MSTIPIKYGEFYDVPRMIDFRLGGRWFFMRSYFDEVKDAYNDYYDVYLLPFTSEVDRQSNPTFFMDLSDAQHLGQIPIRDVGLDETRRRSIAANSISQWLSTRIKGDQS